MELSQTWKTTIKTEEAETVVWSQLSICFSGWFQREPSLTRSLVIHSSTCLEENIWDGTAESNEKLSYCRPTKHSAWCPFYCTQISGECNRWM